MLKECYKCHEYKDKVTRVNITTKHQRERWLCRDCNTDKKRKYRLSEEGKRRIVEASKRAYVKHRAKWMARAKVSYAVKKGLIEKPAKCMDCGEEKSLQGHHTDYREPLKVIWLCSGCHADADKLLEANPQ